jgi:outer membrane protein assembly factor BamC
VKFNPSKLPLRLALCAIALTLGGCSISDLEPDKVDYKSAGKAASLDVPPDLTQLSRDTRYAVPGGAVTATGFNIGQDQPGRARGGAHGG